LTALYMRQIEPTDRVRQALRRAQRDTNDEVRECAAQALAELDASFN
jgi:hypothetical protein